MKTLFHIDGIKIVRNLASGAAWAAIIAVGMILGAAIMAEAAPAVPEFADHHQEDAQGPHFERFSAEPVVSQSDDLQSRLDQSHIFPSFNERLLQTNTSFQVKETPPSRTNDKRRWNFVKIRDVQGNGKTPVVQFEF